MKIKLSKSQWEQVGRTAGWMTKKAANASRLETLQYSINKAIHGLQSILATVKQNPKMADDVNSLKEHMLTFDGMTEDFVQELLLEMSRSHSTEDEYWKQTPKQPYGTTQPQQNQPQTNQNQQPQNTQQ